MKITEKDTELFKALNDSQIGAWLTDYLTRLTDHVCDVRQNTYSDEVRKATAEVLEKELIQRIKLIPQSQGRINESFE